MSLTASTVITSVRATLDYPDYEKLKPQLLLLKLREKVDHYFNRMSLTDRNWFLDFDTLVVNQGTDEYAITAAQFGRPILVETQDSTNPQHIRRPVKVIDLQDRGLFYEGPTQAVVGMSLDSKHTASSFAFYNRQGQKYVKITPQPSMDAEYVIWFEPNRPLPANLASNLLFLDQFQNLLVTDLALCCLPYCDYDSIILSQNSYRQRTKADALREAFMRDFASYLATFEEYIQNDRQQRIEIKQMWGDAPVGADLSLW